MPPKNNEALFSQFVKDSIIIDIAPQTYRKSIKKVFTHKKMQYLSILDKINKQLMIYDTKKFKIAFIKQNISNCKEIIDYDIHNFDTIYILKNNNILELSDTSFKPKKTYNIKEISTEFNSEYELYCSENSPLEVRGNFAYVFHYPKTVLNTEEKLNNYFSKKIELKIDLDNNAIISDYIGFFPHQYKKKFYNSYNFYRVFNENYEILSFNICDTVYQVRNNLIEPKIISSNYYTKRKIFDFSKNKDFNYIKKYFVENPNYEQLFFDKCKKMYYRICKHSLNYENSDGTLNIPGDEDWSLIVADKNFNVQNEILFNSDYSRHDVIITNFGVLIRKNKDNEKTKFDIFNF